MVNQKEPVNVESVAKREGHLICPQPDGYFPHPNPHRFFRCVNGYDYEYICPSDLVWNQIIKKCDYSGASVTSDKQREPTKHVENQVSHVKISDQLSDQVKCDLPNGFLAHPSNSHKFIQCINGKGYELSCPAGLVWNSNSNTCNYSDAK